MQGGASAQGLRGVPGGGEQVTCEGVEGVGLPLCFTRGSVQSVGLRGNTTEEVKHAQ